MGHLDEALARGAADALGGRVRRDEVRVIALELLKPAHELVIVGIGDLGPIENIVEVLVAAQLLSEPVDLGGDVLVHRQSILVKRNRMRVAYPS
jgi:hypothetical protein